MLTDNYYKKLDIENKILYLLCYRDCCICMHEADYVTTTMDIVNITKCSKYRAMKTIEKLARNGLILACSCGGYNDESMHPWYIQGWHITKRAKYLETFRRANWHHAKSMWECWQIVPSQFYVTCKPDFVKEEW